MAADCEQCGALVHAKNGKMVMLKDELWLSIAKKEEFICDCCIEKRLGRPITVEDFKEPSEKYKKHYGINFILVNYLFAMEKGLKFNPL